MKKIVALFTAMMFAMTLSIAFAADQTAPATGEKKPEEKAPAKHKAATKHKVAKKHKAEEKTPAVAPAK